MGKEIERWDRFWKYGDAGITPTRRNLFKIFKLPERFPFDNNMFDLLYSDGLLEYFVDPKPVLGEYLESLRDGYCIANLIQDPLNSKRLDLEYLMVLCEFSRERKLKSRKRRKNS